MEQPQLSYPSAEPNPSPNLSGTLALTKLLSPPEQEVVLSTLELLREAGNKEGALILLNALSRLCLTIAPDWIVGRTPAVLAPEDMGLYWVTIIDAYTQQRFVNLEAYQEGRWSTDDGTVPARYQVVAHCLANLPPAHIS